MAIRMGPFFLAASLLLTFAVYEGFANNSVAQTVARAVSPILSLFATDAEPGYRETPFLYIEKNAIVTFILLALSMSFAAIYGEVKQLQLRGRNKVSAGVFSVGLVTIVLNVVLLVWAI